MGPEFLEMDSLGSKLWCLVSESGQADLQAPGHSIIPSSKRTNQHHSRSPSGSAFPLALSAFGTTYRELYPMQVSGLCQHPGSWISVTCIHLRPWSTEQKCQIWLVTWANERFLSDATLSGLPGSFASYAPSRSSMGICSDRSMLLDRA